MKVAIYLLEREISSTAFTEAKQGGHVCRMVVRGDNEADAREIAANNAGLEGLGPWLSPRTKCHYIGQSLEAPKRNVHCREMYR